MANPAIKFGTDGWRAIIADTYTFDNVAAVTKATAQWLHKEYGDAPSVVIGHDTRFLGRRFSEHSARVFAASGVKVVFADGVTTTPAISWAAKEYGLSAGIVITASHNPPEYSGYKIKANFGGPATPEMIDAVEAELDRLEPIGSLPTFEQAKLDGAVTLRDVHGEYLELLRQRLDIDAIKESGIKIAHDAMYGAGQGVISDLLGTDHVIELRSELNPGFGGQAPEPIERNLEGLSRAVIEEGCAVGIANDGDADRVGMYDEKGQFVSSHLMLALLVKYLHKERGLSGEIVKTFSTTHMLDRIGKEYGLAVRTTPIGFKYIASQIVDGDVLVGGEESGGMAVKGHIPERDGIYIGLLIAEMVVKRGLSLSALVDELYAEFGGHFTHRVDVHTTEEKKRAVLDRLSSGNGPRELAGHGVRETLDMDGYKYVTDDGWLLVRPSGTEPVLRVYSEAGDTESAEQIVEDAIGQLGV
ncbi:MAG: phosphoglucomutase/phosphomannomutase family protein [Rhodothermia bacterium]|nr:phosphoglucomutase/phosphomannomutase family protein [Rhodothermia bacterium]